MAQTANELDATDYTKLAGFDGDWRDCWWNSDYLALLAGRVRLADRRHLLDVGCGVGHWGQRLLPLAHPDARMVGIDREPGFMASATARAHQRGLSGQVTYQQGLAEALPFPDGHFDAVTCQTVLMHATDATAVLAELQRVLAPGGLLLLAEPDNLVNALSPDRGLHPPTLAESLALVELQVVCASGKLALGHGDESIGTKLHALVSAAGFSAVRTWTNDRAAPLLPPYTDPAMALDAGIIRDSDQMVAILEDRSRRHWAAGGGDPDRFGGLWDVAETWRARVRQQVVDGTFSRGGAFTMVVCAAEQPA